MRYRNPKTGAEQKVGAWEVARRKMLEQAGWVKVERPDPEETPPTAPDTPCDPLAAIPYINNELAQALNQAGFWTFASLVQASDAELLAVPGIGPGRLRAIRKFMPGH